MSSRKRLGQALGQIRKLFRNREPAVSFLSRGQKRGGFEAGVRTLIAFHPNISDAGAPIARNAPALCAGGSGQGYLQGVGPMTLTIGLSGN